MTAPIIYLTPAPVRERGGREPNVTDTTPQLSVHSTVSTTPGRVTVEPPTGGDRIAPTRSAATPVAPAPVQVLAKAIVLAGAFFGIHAAATSPITALITAAAFTTLFILAARR